MALFDNPQLSQNLSSADNLDKIKSYLFQNNELLRYVLGNLDPEENYSQGALEKYIERDNKIATLVFSTNGLQVGLKNLKSETETQFKVTAEQITSEMKRATSAENSLSSRITQTDAEIRAEVTNTVKGLQSQITQNANNILLKVSKGEVSSQISLETGTVTISGNRLVVNSTNFTLDAKGNATFSGNVTGATISGGSIEIDDVFYADEEGIILGDFMVSVDDTYCFQSLDGVIKIYTAKSPSGNDSYGIQIDNAAIYGGCLWADAAYLDFVNADNGYNFSYFYDIRLGKSWWKTTITEYIRYLEECVWALAEIIDDQWSDYDCIVDALDDYYYENRPW